MLGVVAHKLSPEGVALLAAMQEQRGRAIHIRPDDVYHTYARGADLPRIMLAQADGDVDLTQLNWVIVRSTTDHEASTALLVMGLLLHGIDFTDPWARFAQIGKASKLLSTVQRNMRQIGTTSHIVFSVKGAERIFSDDANYPLVRKPPSGRHGAGVQLLETRKAAFATLTPMNYPSEGMILQQYVDFQDEYRILIHDLHVIGCAKKLRRGQRFDREGVNGARFERCDVPDEVRALLPRIQMGLIGLDVGVAPDGSLHVIEENYAPEFHRLAEALGVDLQVIADTIVRTYLSSGSDHVLHQE